MRSTNSLDMAHIIWVNVRQTPKFAIVFSNPKDLSHIVWALLYVTKHKWRESGTSPEDIESPLDNWILGLDSELYRVYSLKTFTCLSFDDLRHEIVKLKSWLSLFCTLPSPQFSSLTSPKSFNKSSFKRRKTSKKNSSFQKLRSSDHFIFHREEFQKL